VKQGPQAMLSRTSMNCSSQLSEQRRAEWKAFYLLPAPPNVFGPVHSVSPEGIDGVTWGNAPGYYLVPLQGSRNLSFGLTPRRPVSDIADSRLPLSVPRMTSPKSFPQTGEPMPSIPLPDRREGNDCGPYEPRTSLSTRFTTSRRYASSPASSSVVVHPV